MASGVSSKIARLPVELVALVAAKLPPFDAARYAYSFKKMLENLGSTRSRSAIQNVPEAHVQFLAYFEKPERFEFVCTSCR